MRVLFWRRNNKRLLERLSDVVETSERTRASYRPKPRRVIIDTSFVEPDTNQEDPHTEWQAGHLEIETAEIAGESGRTLGESDVGLPPEASITHPEADPENGSETDGPAMDPALAHEHAEFSILEEAINQLELATQREADALEREAAARQALKEYQATAQRIEAEARDRQARNDRPMKSSASTSRS